MRKRGIPDVPTSLSNRRPFDEAIKENLEQISGARGGVLKPLPPTATQADIIVRLNELMDRLQ